MLQQTRVNTVIPYFQHFLKVFPDIETLAKADMIELNKAWEGLGYYSRARNLKRGAQYCVEHFNGDLPQKPEDLLLIPGIGPYTAGAISSMVYKYPIPAVDGNAIRVTARLFSLYITRQEAAGKKIVYQKLFDLLPEKRAGDFNEAIMDLGANLCTPKSPVCSDCPISNNCNAFRMQLQDTLPLKEKKKASPVTPLTILIFRTEKEIYIRQRSDRGLLAGFFEFVAYPEKLSKAQLLTRLNKDFSVNFTKQIKLTPLGNAKHVFSHLQWDMTGYLIQLSSKDALLSHLPPPIPTNGLSIFPGLDSTTMSALNNTEKMLTNLFDGNFYTFTNARQLPFPSALKAYTSQIF